MDRTGLRLKNTHTHTHIHTYKTQFYKILKYIFIYMCVSNTVYILLMFHITCLEALLGALLEDDKPST